jgi:hypothetical protein
MRVRRPSIWLALFAVLMLVGVSRGQKEAATEQKPAEAEWKPLFDGKTLTNWKMAEFGGSGEPKVKDGNLVIPLGETLSGVAWTGPAKDLPTVNYEIALEAQRVTGSDFFVGLTFPYKKAHASLILGGWGGGVCGISSVDNEDAAHNSTASVRDFKDKRWYRVLLRCTDDKIEAYVDGDQIVDLETTDKNIDTRADIDLSKPLGLSTYQTTAAIKDIKIRTIPAKKEDKK